MLTKIIVVLMLLLIIGSLASGLIFFIRDKGQSDRSVKSLTLRVGLSALLFILLLVAYATGVIQPHGVYPPGHPATQSVPAEK